MATMRQWIAWAEQRIASVVIREGIQVGLVNVVQGPLTVTFCIRLLRPSPISLRKILGLGPALAQTLNKESVRIVDTAQGILIELESPQPRTPTAQELAQHSKNGYVVLGLDQWRKPAASTCRTIPRCFLWDRAARERPRP